MATTIRLARAGSKKRPYYRIIVCNSRSPRDGKFIERLGSYNPLLANDDPNRVIINEERAKHWVSVGAQLSDRVHLFFNKAGIVQTKPAQRPARGPKKAPPEGANENAAPPPAVPAAEAPAAEAPATEPTGGDEAAA